MTSDNIFNCSVLLDSFLQKKEKIAVAVSGGGDSLALCHALAYHSTHPFIHALTVDHGLRPEAAQEAQYVQNIVTKWPQTRHHILTRRCPDHSDTKIQEQARHDRYKLMADYCAQHQICRLFVAHHEDDQAETFLFRLAKGSGLDGLSAMNSIYNYNETLAIIRPFLSLPKETLTSYCSAHNITFIEDPSNTHQKFARARLRHAHDLLAKEGLTSKRLATTARRLYRAREALEIYTEQIFNDVCLKNSLACVVLSFDRLAQQPEELRIRVLTKTLNMVAPPRNYGIRMEKIESLAHRIFIDNDFKKSSLGGCLITLNRKISHLTIETAPVKSIS